VGTAAKGADEVIRGLPAVVPDPANGNLVPTDHLAAAPITYGVPISIAQADRHRIQLGVPNPNHIRFDVRPVS
jgi:hypothetical protein